jgi:6-pyruvoyl-tetrahydropterin synthase
MLSKEKLLEAVDTYIVELMAEQICAYIRKDLQEQWDKVIVELVSTRKSNEYLKESVAELQRNNVRLERLFEQFEAKTKLDEEKQRKQIALLDVALKETGE